ncbi:carbon-nitrogen hydrolase family protein [Coralliovum pocilloporae]|uniref:carbon-nitrogen hydrolase family protein n=1 Tax=Coralliovum pocilloporae TaxID=3066369 RepID=UPI0033074FEB
MTSSLTVGVAQCPADLATSEERLRWLSNTLASNTGLRPDLIVLPELFQCGYNIGEAILDRAETPDGPFAEAIAELSRHHQTAILYGFAERQDKTLFNTAQCIDRTGRLIGQHRKLVLPPGFEENYFAPGHGCELFQLADFTVAILVCYDVEFPEALRHVALNGADLVLVPTALGAQWGVVAESVVPARAFENGVFLCYANYTGQENHMHYYGGSCIIAPDGKALARAEQANSGLSLAVLEKSAVERAQIRLPYHTDRFKLPWISKQRTDPEI